MTEQTITLDRARVPNMTGWELMQAAGIYDPEQRTWQNNDPRSFSDTTRTWTVYSTSGRGRHNGTTYVHLLTKGTIRIVNPDGTPTGQSMPWTYHYRGRASERVGSFLEVD